MAYLEQLQAGLRYLGRAGESGRKSLDKVVAPVNGAISEIAAQPRSWNLPGVSPEMAAGCSVPCAASARRRAR